MWDLPGSGSNWCPLHFNMDFQPLDAQGSPLYSLKTELKSNPTKSNIWHPFWITNIKSGKRYTYTPTEKNKRSDKETSQTAIFQLLLFWGFCFFFLSPISAFLLFCFLLLLLPFLLKLDRLKHELFISPQSVTSTNLPQAKNVGVTWFPSLFPIHQQLLYLLLAESSTSLVSFATFPVSLMI